MYLDESLPEMHDVFGTTERSLSDLDVESLSPGANALAALQRNYR
jgi:hypothetical protein